jgi:hypothetical protein
LPNLAHFSPENKALLAGRKHGMAHQRSGLFIIWSDCARDGCTVVEVGDTDARSVSKRFPNRLALAEESLFVPTRLLLKGAFHFIASFL